MAVLALIGAGPGKSAFPVGGSDNTLPTPDVSIRVIGQAEVVYRWSAGRCDRNAVPDAPARAFRDDRGAVRLVATSSANWSMLGPDLDHLKADCHPLIVGAKLADPDAFNDVPWIEATYSKDGRHVVALLSNEWSALRHSETALARESGCSDPHQQACYFYSITQAFSDDSGAYFAYRESDHVAAALAETFAGTTKQGSHGFATVSNIVFYKGYYYVFTGFRGGGGMQPENCLMRTRNLDEPGSWLGWDGREFTVNMVQIERASPRGDGSHFCNAISVPEGQGEEVRSLTWHAPSGSFIAVVRGTLRQNAQDTPVAGFFYATSRDLIHWSSARLIMQVSLESECKPLYFYPSLLDPASQDRNFGVADDSAYLYYTRFNVLAPRCRGVSDRDLVRLRLLIASEAR